LDLLEFYLADGKVIPRGTNVGISPFCMGRNEKLWENPLEFKPERFTADAPQKHPFLHLPFGAGPR
jgi:cytochrome P450